MASLWSASNQVWSLRHIFVHFRKNNGGINIKISDDFGRKPKRELSKNWWPVYISRNWRLNEGETKIITATALVITPANIDLIRFLRSEPRRNLPQLSGTIFSWSSKYCLTGPSRPLPKLKISALISFLLRLFSTRHAQYHDFNLFAFSQPTVWVGENSVREEFRLILWAISKKLEVKTLEGLETKKSRVGISKS